MKFSLIDWSLWRLDYHGRHLLHQSFVRADEAEELGARWRGPVRVFIRDSGAGGGWRGLGEGQVQRLDGQLVSRQTETTFAHSTPLRNSV